MTTLTEARDYLAHFGVKGMQWGVRKNRSSKSSSSSSSSKPQAKDMTDDDLKKAISRMQLEKQYSDLSSPPKKSGSNYANSLLQSAGKTAMSTIVAAVTAKAVKKTLGN